MDGRVRGTVGGRLRGRVPSQGLLSSQDRLPGGGQPRGHRTHVEAVLECSFLPHLLPAALHACRPLPALRGPAKDKEQTEASTDSPSSATHLEALPARSSCSFSETPVFPGLGPHSCSSQKHTHTESEVTSSSLPHPQDFSVMGGDSEDKEGAVLLRVQALHPLSWAWELGEGKAMLCPQQ
ncbi:Tripartite Motif-Containing Protein 5 [Manis pentadactyla]|nr:Tripartite Motif-Containing Protein 5 [Manis pentadactyla]